MWNPEEIRHPIYISDYKEWEKWRYTYQGGYDFINRYLKKFSIYEDDTDFATRKEITYSPSLAAAAIDHIKNTIFDNFKDISRSGGTNSYIQACQGKLGGVDLNNSSINAFIGNKVLIELLTMRRVGIYVDMPSNIPTTLYQNPNNFNPNSIHPYLYIYPVEDICSWSDGQSVLLRDYSYINDDFSGLPSGKFEERYRLIQKNPDNTVSVTFYDSQNEKGDLERQWFQSTQHILNIDILPFILVDIGKSLLKDAADYQISLLNIASSDVAYIHTANFPFYTEQEDGFTPKFQKDSLNPSNDSNSPENINVGVIKGRKYTKERPSFIHPSPEPLLASLKKQEIMSKEIKELINVSLESLGEGSERGLSYIGFRLQQAEQLISQIWSIYENNPNNIATITYPQDYTIKTEQSRRQSAKELSELLPKIPSNTYQKHMAILLVKELLGHKVNPSIIDDITNEIMDAKAMTSDPDIIASDLEHGILDEELASELRLYPEGTVQKARLDHANRIARIAAAQSENNNLINGSNNNNQKDNNQKDNSNNLKNPDARGVEDQSVDSQGAKKEKELSRQSNIDDTIRSKIRGKSK